MLPFSLSLWERKRSRSFPEVGMEPPVHESQAEESRTHIMDCVYHRKQYSMQYCIYIYIMHMMWIRCNLHLDWGRLLPSHVLDVRKHPSLDQLIQLKMMGEN